MIEEEQEMKEYTARKKQDQINAENKFKLEAQQKLQKELEQKELEKKEAQARLELELKNKEKNNTPSSINKTELAKHASKSDAQIVLSGKVYDITKYIHRHPGGNVILKGLGKDATELFSKLSFSFLIYLLTF